MLRYLTDAYRTLRQTVPDAHRSPELEEIIEWLGETVRQTDSSLLDEWEALDRPRAPRAARRRARRRTGPAAAALSQQERPLRVMVRNAVFRRVELVARDDVRPGGARAHRRRPGRPAAGGRDGRGRVGRGARGVLRGARPGRHRPDARGPELLTSSRPADGRRATWRVRQTLDDPAGHRDWVLEAVVDLDATDDAGEPSCSRSGRCAAWGDKDRDRLCRFRDLGPAPLQTGGAPETLGGVLRHVPLVPPV